MVLNKLIPLKKNKTLQNSWFFIVGTIENKKMKKSLTVSKHFNFPFLCTPLDPSSNSHTFLRLKNFKVDYKISTLGLKDKVTFETLSY